MLLLTCFSNQNKLELRSMHEHSRALQDSRIYLQFVKQDVAIICNLAGLQVTAVLVNTLSNYMCNPVSQTNLVSRGHVNGLDVKFELESWSSENKPSSLIILRELSSNDCFSSLSCLMTCPHGLFFPATGKTISSTNNWFFAFWHWFCLQAFITKKT